MVVGTPQGKVNKSILCTTRPRSKIQDSNTQQHNSTILDANTTNALYCKLCQSWEGQLEPSYTTQVPSTYEPATEKDLYTFHNKSTGKMQQIDMRTGRVHEAYLPMKTNEFCNQTADLICQEILQGTSLKETLKAFNVPNPVFYRWLAIFPEFHKRYTEARKQRADYHFHRAVELADGALGMPKEFIPGVKLAVDTHKWAAEKSDPERFAKPKEEGNTIGNITINLQTGVLEKQPPKDIVVDQFGNFQGFGDDAVVIDIETLEETVQLDSNRWGEYDGKEEEVTSGSIEGDVQEGSSSNS